MGKKVTPAEFARWARVTAEKLKATPREAQRANARLLASVLREHITRDDLPLEALSPAWLAHKASKGFDKAHLRYTGAYLGNMIVASLPGGAFVGTSRPAKGFPTAKYQSLPELLEAHYPVWRLSLDERQAQFKANLAEAVSAALESREPNYKEQ